MASYVGILDGQTLWLAVDAAPGTLALREDGDHEIHPLVSDITEDDPAYRSVRASLLDLPGDGQTAYDVVLLPPHGRGPRLVWVAPFPATPTRVPVTRDGRWRFWLGRTDAGMLRIHRDPAPPALDVLDLAVDGGDLRITFTATDATELRLVEDGAALATYPITRDGDRCVAVITEPALPEGSDQLAEVLAGDVPLRRARNDLANPHHAVLLPVLFGDEPDLERLRLRWSGDGLLLARIVDSDAGGGA